MGKIYGPGETAMFRERHASREEEATPLSPEEKIILKKAQQAREAAREQYADQYEAKDAAFLKKMRGSESTEAETVRGQNAEWLLSNHIEGSFWLGENAHTSITSEYDDVANHVDFVVEWEREDSSPIRLGIDVTIAENPEAIDKKVRFIRTELEQGRLGTVKYFASEVDGSEGRVSLLPRVILSMSREEAQRLSQEHIAQKGRLAKHPEQLLLIKQIRLQMQDQMNYVASFLLDGIEQTIDQFSDRDKPALIAFAKAAARLQNDSSEITGVVATLQSQPELIEKFEAVPGVKKYLTELLKLAEVANLTTTLEQEKSGQLGPQVVEQAARQEGDNVVIKAFAGTGARFRLPFRLAQLAEAA